MKQMQKAQIPNGWISLSDFGQITGLNGRTIREAVKIGRIPPEYVKRIGTTSTAPYYIDPQRAAVYWSNNIGNNRPLSKAVSDALVKYIQTFDVEMKNEVPVKEGSVSYVEAQRRERAAKARLAELEVQVEEAALVARESVDDQLFAAGKELRDALLAIPDRITDLVMAMDNRAMIHNTIYEAIAGELQKIADFQLKVSANKRFDR